MLGLRKNQVVLRTWCPKMYCFCLSLNKSHGIHIKKKKEKNFVLIISLNSSFIIIVVGGIVLTLKL